MSASSQPLTYGAACMIVRAAQERVAVTEQALRKAEAEAEAAIKAVREARRALLDLVDADIKAGGSHRADDETSRG